MGSQKDESARVAGLRHEVLALLGPRASVASIEVHEQSGLVLVRIRLPRMPDQARVAVQEWVELQLSAVERAHAEDGLLLSARYV